MDRRSSAPGDTSQRPHTPDPDDEPEQTLPPTKLPQPRTPPPLPGYRIGLMSGMHQLPSRQQMFGSPQIPGNLQKPGYQQAPDNPQISGQQLSGNHQQFSGHQQISGHQYASNNHQGPVPASPLQYPPSTPDLQSPIMPLKVTPGSEIIIAMMGATGKSYFIREVTGNSSVIVGGSLSSCTSEVQAFAFEYGGVKVTLVDTPGLDNIEKSDPEIQKDIHDWIFKTYKQNRPLSGIIYLYSITDIRMEGSALKNLRMFQNLCGCGSLGNVLLATTQWSNIDPEVGKNRETELRGEYCWGGLLEGGGALRRFQGTRKSGLELICKLISNNPQPPDTQEQIINREKILAEVNAEQSISKELFDQAKEELESLKRGKQEAIRTKDSEMKPTLAEEPAKVQGELDKTLPELQEREAEKHEAVERGRAEGIAERMIAVAKSRLKEKNSTEKYEARGSFITDTEEIIGFDSQDFEVVIESDRNFVLAWGDLAVEILSPFFPFIKPIMKIVDLVVGGGNFIDYNEARYWREGGLVKNCRGEFAIFKRRS